MLRKLSLSTIGCAMLMVGMAADPESWIITLTNDSEYIITGVYISPSGHPNDIRNILQTPLEEDDFALVRPSREERYWDLKLVYDNGASEIWRNLDFSTIKNITVITEHGKLVLRY